MRTEKTSPASPTIGRAYTLMFDEVVRFRAAFHIPHDALPYAARVRVYDGGPDRPALVVAEHTRRWGSAHLGYTAADLRPFVAARAGVDVDTMLWVNRLPGKLGSYSRRSERFEFVDFDTPRDAGRQLAATPTTRRRLGERFGVEVPTGDSYADRPD